MLCGVAVESYAHVVCAWNMDTVEKHSSEAFYQEHVDAGRPDAGASHR
jgi:hypothetical protein